MIMLSVELPKISVSFESLLADVPEVLLGSGADFLLLPVYEASKGYENGATSGIIYDLIGEVLETYDTNEQQRRNILHEFVQSFLSVRNPFGRLDTRDEFREVMEKYGEVFNDQSISLEVRIRVFQLLLNVICLPNIKQIIL